MKVELWCPCFRILSGPPLLAMVLTSGRKCANVQRFSPRQNRFPAAVETSSGVPLLSATPKADKPRRRRMGEELRDRGVEGGRRFLRRPFLACDFLLFHRLSHRHDDLL